MTMMIGEGGDFSGEEKDMMMMTTMITGKEKEDL